MCETLFELVVFLSTHTHKSVGFGSTAVTLRRHNGVVARGTLRSERTVCFASKFVSAFCFISCFFFILGHVE